MKNISIRTAITLSIGTLLLIFVITNGVMLALDMKEYLTAQSEYSNITDTVTTEATKKPTIVQEEENFSSTRYNVPDFNVNHEELEGINPSYIGWLYIPSLEISYPMVASADNIDYLKKTFQGKSNAAGCLFSDCRNDNPLHQRTIVYGHNMKDGTMFANLFDLESADLSSEIEVWVYVADGTIQRYIVTTVQRAWSTDETIYYMDPDPSTLVLSTCVEGDERLIVICTKTATYI